MQMIAEPGSWCKKDLSWPSSCTLPKGKGGSEILPLPNFYNEVVMGMFDTFNFNCANCGEETDAQTKLGECALDYWRLNDETTLEDGCYRVKDTCHECKHRNTVVIVKRHFVAVLKDAPTIAMQEGHWGALLKLDVDFEEYEKNLFAEVGKMIKAAAGETNE